MANLLFTTLPTNDLGLVTRALPIAEILRGRGHSVVFSSPGAVPSAQLATACFPNVLPPHPIFELFANGPTPAGLARILLSRGWRDRGSTRRRFVRQLRHAMPRERAPSSDPPWNVDHAAAQMGMLSEAFVQACSGATLELVRATGVDAVVDFWNPFAAIAARAADVLHISVIQADAHPQSRGFRWWLEPPPHIPSPADVVSSVLTAFGASPVGSVAELAIGDLTLVVGSPLTDPLPPGAAGSHVGAILWQPEDEGLPAWVHELGQERPLIWIYAGNPRYGASKHGPMDSAVVVQAAVEAVRAIDADAVVTTGAHPLPLRARSLPPNVYVTDYLPGLALARHSDLLVHHGGYGSCQTGLVAATPAVIVPTFAERESNARRLESLGAAVVVPLTRTKGPPSVDVGHLHTAIANTLSSTDMKASACRMSDHLARFGGAKTAADLIEDLLR